MEPGVEAAERREKAVRRLSVPTDLDQALTVVTPRAVCSLAATVLLAGAIVAWGFLGKIPLKVTGQGLVIPPRGLFTVESAAVGMVGETLGQAGQTVSRGEHLLTVADPQLTVQLDAARSLAAMLRVSLDALNQQIALEGEAERKAIQREIEAQQYTVERHSSNLLTASNTLAMTTRLFDQGIVSRQVLESDAQALRAQEVQYESAKAVLATLQSKSVRSYRTEEYQARHREWLAAQDEVESLRTKQAQGRVESPADGKILETLVSVGDYVEKGTPLFWMEHAYDTTEQQHLYGCVPVEVGGLLEPGTRVTVDFPTFGPQNYGSLAGRVIDVSQYAVSPENLHQVVKNAALVQYLLGGQTAVIAVRIAPELDATHITGYRWEGGPGPPGRLPSGIVGTLRATVKSVAPITYVLSDLGG